MIRPLRVLALAEFDPAGVVLSHRDALRAIGSGVVEIKVALEHAFTPRHRDADWLGDRGVNGDSGEELEALHEWADVVQIHPGISQASGLSDLEYRHAGVLVGAGLANKPVVRFVHGSKRMWGLLDGCAPTQERYAASTLDYATRLGCAWLPPWLPNVFGRVPLRGAGEDMVIAHCPTDPANCGTEELIAWVRERYPRACLNYCHRKPWQASIETKLVSNALFDHARGSFSVNTLEGCMLGLDTHCVLLQEYAETGRAQGMIGNPFASSAGMVWAAMDVSLANREHSRRRQAGCRIWFEENFGLMNTVGRLERFYREIAR